MATQRNMYEANNSSVFLPTYADSAPHRANSSFEDVKSEDDIIDSYSTTAVPIPKQAYPGNHSSTHLPTNQPVPFYPPYNQKPSFHSTNMSTTDFGTEENSNYQLHGTKEMPQAEKRSLIETVGKLVNDTPLTTDIRVCSYFRTHLRVDSTCLSSLSKQ